MKLIRCLLGILLLAAGCDTARPKVETLHGTYVGYFHRSGRDTSQVSLEFQEDKFGGTTDHKHASTLCQGSFQQTATTITFTDSCASVNALNQPHVLNGDYYYNFNYDGTLRIWRSTESSEDEYILKKLIGLSTSL